MSDRLDWNRDGRDWPFREASRFVKVTNLDWHVQVIGDGEAPVLLLLHGTGASTHSWRRLIPLLSSHFTLVAPDLPGHGFTGMPDWSGLSLPGMAAGVGALMNALGLQPEMIVSHSAGTAVAIEATAQKLVSPHTILSINGALTPFGGSFSEFFSPLAKFLASTPMVAQLMTWRAQSRAAVENVIRGTGSDIAPEDIDYYWRLFRTESHVTGALRMMGNWNLAAFQSRLGVLKPKLVLVAGENDRAVPPADAHKVGKLVPDAEVVMLKGVGHLAHEESPLAVAQCVRSLGRATAAT